MNAPAAFPNIAQPFQPRDTAIPRWAADKIRAGDNRSFFSFCATVVRCYVDHTGPAPRWIIEILTGEKYPADEWERVTVTKQEANERGGRGTLFTYSVAGG